MEIRKIMPSDDLEAISNIYSTSWKSAYKGIIPQDYLDSLSGSRWTTLLQDTNYDSYVLMDKHVYIGTASVCPARDDTMFGWGEIVSIYLLPEYWGKGLADILLESIVQSLSSAGFKNIYLWVLEGNFRAQRFYEKHGFKKSSDTINMEISGEKLTEIRYIYKN